MSLGWERTANPGRKADTDGDFEGSTRRPTAAEERRGARYHPGRAGWKRVGEGGRDGSRRDQLELGVRAREADGRGGLVSRDAGTRGTDGDDCDVTSEER